MPLKKQILSDTPLSLPSNQGPVWKGPTVDGISQTLLGRYLTCPERFRVMVIEGLQVTPTFNNRLEFGNMWHVCEEAHANSQCKVCNGTRSLQGVSDYGPCPVCDWNRALLDYANELGKIYPTQLMQIVHWIKVTEALFPAYIEYWSNHPDTINRTPLLQEERFAVPYSLPSGRTALLRGKWDSVDLVKEMKARTKADHAVSNNDGIWLMENKTKSVIDVQKINRQLRFDLQVMLYLVALYSHQKATGIHSELQDSKRGGFVWDYLIKGVRYNVIRRSSHKTADSMMKKVSEDIKAHRAGEWFSRWNVEIDTRDIQVFKDRCLDPILDNLLDDYEWWAHCRKYRTTGYDGEGRPNVYDTSDRHKVFSHHRRRHFIMPYIGYNPLSEGGESDVDNYVFTGNEIGLQRVENLFPELA